MSSETQSPELWKLTLTDHVGNEGLEPGSGLLIPQDPGFGPKLPPTLAETLPSQESPLGTGMGLPDSGQRPWEVTGAGR